MSHPDAPLPDGAPFPDFRHFNADTTPVTIERSDAMDAVRGLYMFGAACRKPDLSRHEAMDLLGIGSCWEPPPSDADLRAWLLSTANVFEAAAIRVGTAAHDAGRY